MSKHQESFVISLNPQQSLNHETDKTLLESLEQHKVAVHFHCREGFCGACRTKLIAGTVEYKVDPLAFINDDEILPCCCVPTSDIKLQLD